MTGLILGLGLSERRRSSTILSALGAKRGQLGVFLWSEGLFVVVGGAVLVMVAGVGLAEALVTMLAGVFDPPPESLSVPWLFIATILGTGLTCGAAAILAMQALSRQPDLEALRGG